MASAVSDGTDDERLSWLPESVERVVGAAVKEQNAPLNEDALASILEEAEKSAKDSNFDTIMTVFGVDVLADGTHAVRVLVDALKRRRARPIRPGEQLVRVSTQK